jgi:hypothetical protein
MYNPYNPKQLGACGPKNKGCPEGVEQYFVAMDSVEFDSASPVSYDNPYCHRCMMVTNPENGNTVTVYLTDSCVGCGANAIDLSLQAMSDLVGGNDQAYKQGIIKNAQWKLVPCPETLGAGDFILETTDDTPASTDDIAVMEVVLSFQDESGALKIAMGLVSLMSLLFLQLYYC